MIHLVVERESHSIQCFHRSLFDTFLFRLRQFPFFLPLSDSCLVFSSLHSLRTFPLSLVSCRHAMVYLGCISLTPASRGARHWQEIFDGFSSQRLPKHTGIRSIEAAAEVSSELSPHQPSVRGESGGFLRAELSSIKFGGFLRAELSSKATPRVPRTDLLPKGCSPGVLRRVPTGESATTAIRCTFLVPSIRCEVVVHVSCNCLVVLIPPMPFGWSSQVTLRHLPRLRVPESAWATVCNSVAFCCSFTVPRWCPHRAALRGPTGGRWWRIKLFFQYEAYAPPCSLRMRCWRGYAQAGSFFSITTTHDRSGYCDPPVSASRTSVFSTHSQVRACEHFLRSGPHTSGRRCRHPSQDWGH